MKHIYVYGMKHARGFGIGCQPKEGLIGKREKTSAWYGREYEDIIEYNRELTEQECFTYDLDFLEREEVIE